MQLTLHQFDLPLRHPFGISRGMYTVQRTLIVELEQDGAVGYGEATENAFYGASIETMSAALEHLRADIEASTLDDPALFWQRMHNGLADSPFAQCALDIAAHDLWGKLREQPVWKLWGLTLDNLPRSNYTIGIDSIDVMIEKLEEFPGWSVYKIKLGTPDDLEIVRRLREHTDAMFRVDANCAWTADETIRNAKALKPLGVEFIEQPLPADDWDGMRRVFRESALTVVADESCEQPADVDRCAGCFHVVNIKLVKCGGLTPARRMIDRARQLGLKVMVGCMTESTVGISAVAQLLPLLDYVDMDGALLLSQDIATGVTVEPDRVCYPAENGCGVRLLT
jgi:L-alanine-DL-glutamate epimerase-like enolase superfamily enzyme